MASIGPIVVYDGAATPVLHTLEPIGTNKDAVEGYTAEWREQIAALQEDLQISIKTQRQTLKNGVKRTVLNVKVPEAELVTGQNSSGYTAAPKVAFEDTIVISLYAHPRSTALSNRRIRQIAANLLNGIATSVTPTTTGAIPQLFDNGISPS